MSAHSEDFLKPFIAHGFEQTGASGNEVIGTCPFSGKRDAFHINQKKRVWHSKRVGDGGNLSHFLHLMIAQYAADLTLRRLSRLADDRQLPSSAFQPWEFGWDGQSYTLGVRD